MKRLKARMDIPIVGVGLLVALEIIERFVG